MIAKSICGRKFKVENPPENPEDLCNICNREGCITYNIHLYTNTDSDS
jgi:hypothetical protein